MSRFKPIPQVSNVTSQEVMDNYFQVKYDVRELIDKEVSRLVAIQEAANSQLIN